MGKVDSKVYHDLNTIMKFGFIYELGSHMGCACGLGYGEWSLEDKREKHQQRVKDVSNMANYLSANMHQNRLRLFCTEWDDVHENYEKKQFVLNNISKEEFEFEEDVILNVV